MYRFRQHERYTPERLAEIYSEPHKHDQWPDHIHRVEKTIEFAKRLGFFGRVADLSCGDATIARALSGKPILGDFAYHPDYDYRGSIEQTIHQLPGFVDVFILSETLEHLDDPDRVLKQIRLKSRQLLLTTPKCYGPDDNLQHYWVWDDEAVREMLVEADWHPVDYTEAYNGVGYVFQIWGAR